MKGLEDDFSNCNVNSVAKDLFGRLKRKRQGLHLDACLSSSNWNTLKAVALSSLNFSLLAFIP